MFGRNADAVILYHQDGFIAFLFHGYPDMPVFVIIFNSVVTEIVNNTVYLLPDTLYEYRFPGKQHGDMRFFRRFL